MRADAVESLQELGFSLYEARLYLGLLAHGPQNGNELSRTSGVPSSKVYSTCDKLAAAGVVEHSRQGGTQKYVCIPPEELLKRYREKYMRPLEHLGEVLPELATAQPVPDVLQIANTEAIFDHARGIIDSASSELYLSFWSESLDQFHDSLVAADARGVRVFTMIYGDTRLDIGTELHHSYRDTVATRIGGHMLTLVADGEEALIAHMPARGEPTAVHTRNPVLCLVAEEYLRHDLILQKAKTMTGFDEWDRWLQGDEAVRSVMLGRTGHESSIEPV
jgi:sugar-specific transcriptional regulator TrmB